jgi:hypothetical protein
MPPNSDIVPAAGFRTTRLPSPPTCRFLASLHLTLEHHEVVHQLLHARARRRRELLGRRVIHSLSGIAELVGSPRQRPSLPQQRRDRLRRRRLRPVHGVGGHALIVGHALDCAARHKLPTSDRAQRSRCCKRTRPRQSPDLVVVTRSGRNQPLIPHRWPSSPAIVTFADRIAPDATTGHDVEYRRIEYRPSTSG